MGNEGEAPPPPTHTHMVACPVTIDAKTTVPCSLGSSVVLPINTASTLCVKMPFFSSLSLSLINHKPEVFPCLYDLNTVQRQVLPRWRGTGIWPASACKQKVAQLQVINSALVVRFPAGHHSYICALSVRHQQKLKNTKNPKKHSDSFH